MVPLRAVDETTNEAFSDIFEKWEDNRDYKDEYEKFHSSEKFIMKRVLQLGRIAKE